LCDVGLVVVKNCFKLLFFYTFIAIIVYQKGAITFAAHRHNVNVLLFFLFRSLI